MLPTFTKISDEKTVLHWSCEIFPTFQGQTAIILAFLWGVAFKNKSCHQQSRKNVLLYINSTLRY